MKNELMVIGRELMVIDDGVLDFVSQSLEAKAMSIQQEVSATVDQLNTIHTAIGKVLHTFSFEFPDISDQLRVLLNQLAIINNKPVVDKHIDPLSGRDKDGEYDRMVEQALRSKQQAEDQYEAEVRESDDGKVLIRECKRLYRKLSSACHPDKVKDKSLHPVFDVATKANEDLNLELLQQLWHVVSKYIKLRANNKDFQAYVKDQIERKSRDLQNAKNKLAELKSTLAYSAFKASHSKSKTVRKAAYNAFIQQECMKVRKLIEAATPRTQSFSFGFNSSTTGSTFFR